MFVHFSRQEWCVFIAAKLCAERPSALSSCAVIVTTLIKFTFADNCPQSRWFCRKPSRRSPKWTNACLWRMKSCSGSFTTVIWAAPARSPLPRPWISSHRATLRRSPALPSCPDNNGLQLLSYRTEHFLHAEAGLDHVSGTQYGMNFVDCCTDLKKTEDYIAQKHLPMRSPSYFAFHVWLWRKK